MRGVGGVIAGILTGVIAMMLVSFVGTLFVPPPTVDPSSAEAIKATYSSLSLGGRVLVVVAWFVGALAGGLMAKRIAGEAWAAWTVAGIVTAYALLSVLMLPMPAWMQITGLAAPVIGGFVANHLVKSRLSPDPGAGGTSADAEI